MNSDISIILISIVSLSIIGGLSGILLAYAAEKFKVEIDPKIKEVLVLLPGVDCGACGYRTCWSQWSSLPCDAIKHGLYTE